MKQLKPGTSVSFKIVPDIPGRAFLITVAPNLREARRDAYRYGSDGCWGRAAGSNAAGETIIGRYWRVRDDPLPPPPEMKE